ncbi:pyrroloquinoline quinone biosynthesis peptide chaperone PqqD [Belnapia rosea]|uniref:Pyrroloquinoline quinone biosynthesis protein D n=1 Tax=Belnapia rosea TaxID=938405 RepID=A0A1G6LQ17_9PROT|nr:pyrroloquinoline quinone biosynthesis peptide chaperone PqqD [Belnapia rosea]SDC45214.1 pyrroloquinoline quinone biosynthesis protein D [Belnapia rosea]
MTPDSIPRLARGMKLREDKARAQWVVLGPERMFVPDEIALEILRLLDGSRSLGAIADTLATRYAAPHDEILADIAALLDDLAAKGVVTA